MSICIIYLLLNLFSIIMIVINVCFHLYKLDPVSSLTKYNVIILLVKYIWLKSLFMFKKQTNVYKSETKRRWNKSEKKDK